MAPRTNSKSLDDAYPRPLGPQLSVVGGTNHEQVKPVMEDGTIKIEHPDGSVTIDFNPQPDSKPDTPGHSENLAKRMDEARLAEIASDLLEGIDTDERSRSEWLSTRAMGISLLGLKLEKPRADASSTSAPLEGMAQVRHPLLLGAVTSFQATARAELLPASGPVKVRNDTPPKPQNIDPSTSAAQAIADSLENKDELAQALEKDLNHYLTSIATEYVPDTDRMLFLIGFGGDGFKKVYNCPLRRRPVSESVNAEDLIVSDATVDLQSCGRITHRIKMRKSVLRRMQIMGAYRDVDLSPPAPPPPNPVDQKKEEISGQRSAQKRPEDRDYEVFEVYCELDLDEFAPTKFKGKGLPLPYRVTIEKESRQILDIRRNWKESDNQCMPKQFFVQFPFIRGLGFYGLGYIHLLGNTTNALTAAWRMALDAGMFGNFPGFLIAKGAGRQNTTNIRVGPGQGYPIDVGAQQDIKQAVMPLPYKDVSASFIQFMTHVEEVGQKLSSTANTNVGEGKQDAPVGTTLALIEQASKVIDSAHKRLHAAQAEEFKLLKERFREDPEAFWRHNKKPTVAWQKDQFIQALDTCELVPVADPNNPTSLHRIAKALAIKELQKASPLLYDPQAVDMRIMRIVDIDPSGLFRPTPAQPPPDPRMEAIKQKSQQQAAATAQDQQEITLKAQIEMAKLADKEKDRISKERIAEKNIDIAKLKLIGEQVIHAHDAEREDRAMMHEVNLETQLKQQEMHHNTLDKVQELHHNEISHAQEIHRDRIQAEHERRMSADEVQHKRMLAEHERQQAEDHHTAELARAEEKHQLEVKHAREKHSINLEAAKKLGDAKAAAARKMPKPKPAAKK